MKNNTAFAFSAVLLLAAFLLGLVMPETPLAEQLKLSNFLLRAFAYVLAATGIYILIKQFLKNQ